MLMYLDHILDVIHDFNMISVVLRVMLAASCGAVLGIERAKSHQAAGMRTYMVVCLGSAIVMLTSHYMYLEFNTGDPARLGAQVISGIGFLGAGSIILEGKTRVKGLTTAAGLWTSACIGLAIGIGFYSGGVLATAAVYLITSKLKPVAKHFRVDEVEFGIYIQMENSENFADIFLFIKECGGTVEKMELNKSHEDGTCRGMIYIHLPTSDNPDTFIDMLRLKPHVITVKEISYI